MIILGIDPGDTITGFGVVRREGSRLSLVAHGCIKTPPVKDAPIPQKLATIEREISALIQTHRPDIAAVEELFFSKNVKTGIRVAQARGVILATCENNGVRVVEFTPPQIKLAVAGWGKADKKQMQRMTALLLGLAKPLVQDDAADAVACAICASSSVFLQ